MSSQFRLHQLTNKYSAVKPLLFEEYCQLTLKLQTGFIQHFEDEIPALFKGFQGTFRCFPGPLHSILNMIDPLPALEHFDTDISGLIYLEMQSLFKSWIENAF